MRRGAAASAKEESRRRLQGDGEREGRRQELATREEWSVGAGGSTGAGVERELSAGREGASRGWVGVK
jgi:hypothetical protein